MIKIKTLEFSNIFSYGDGNSINLAENAVTQIIGRNGSGKSSIALILEDALYNKNSKGVKKSDIKNRHTTEPTTTKVVFEVNGQEYTLNKVVRSTAKVSLFRGKEDISGHTATQTYKLLQDILQLDFNTFSKLVYQSTQSSLDFLTATDTNRKKFLVSLLGLEELVEVENTLKTAKRDADKELVAIKTKLSTIESFLARTKPLENISLVDVPEQPSALVEEVADKNASISLVDSVNSRIANARLAQANYDTVLSAKPPQEVDHAEELNNATVELTRVQTNKARLKVEYDRLKGKSDTCPTCKQKIDISDAKIAMESIKKEFAELKEQEAPLIAAKSDLTKLQNVFKEYVKWESKHNIAKAKLDSVEPCDDQEQDANLLKKEVKALKAQIASIRADITAAENHNKSAVANNARVEDTNKRIQEYSDELVVASESLNAVTQKVADLDVLTKAFGTKGLVAYKIESMLKVFEKLLNEYLVQLSDGRFALVFEVEGEKLNVKLYDNSTPVDIKSLSSGELNRVNTSTLLAVRQLMSSASKVHINCLILDEVISVLDEDGFSTLVDTLFKQQNLNSFVVSHGRSADPRVGKLQVTKVNNISEING